MGDQKTNAAPTQRTLRGSLPHAGSMRRRAHSLKGTIAMESKLFTPLQLRGVTMRNRVVASPMLTYSATGGYTNDWHIVHLGKIAAGGAGLVFMESTKVDPHGCSTARDTGLWKDEFVEPL